MNTYPDFQPKDLAGLDLQLLASALQALQELVSAADGDIYSDAPECQVAVNRVQDAIQAGYQALIRIRQALEPPKPQEPVETLARRILDEAEEAFAARSLAERRAREGRFPRPVIDPGLPVLDRGRAPAARQLPEEKAGRASPAADLCAGLVRADP